jgi:CTP:molybdopterin cytidylyltransferase MocA
VINAFGWWTALLYLTGRLTLSRGLRQISKTIGCRAGIVILPFPEAAIDVDTVEDWKFVNDIYTARK